MTDLAFSAGTPQGGGGDWVSLANTVVGLTQNNDPIVREGRRLQALQLLTARPGQPMARVYGRMRIGGHVIWRGALNEHVHESGGGGGKGAGPAQPINRSFSYSLDLAIGLCEGPISHIGRIWADGQLLDSAGLHMSLYKGTPSQMPDPLILRDKGEAQTPAFRGLGYLVLRDFDVTRFGNRVPQLSFEVFRPIARKRAPYQAVCLLPGATEFGYHPEQHIRLLGISEAEAENIHASPTASDWQISLDQLQDGHPECRRVALVVSWFGTDLRADKCRLEPRIDGREKNIWPTQWQVAGISRRQATVVSHIDERAAFGGTPADAAVIAAIEDLHRRGLEVMFYPFIMMDVPADNKLPHPYGDAHQPPFPWRGRISCHPAPGRPGSPDGTAQIDDIVSHFATQLDTMIGHYAQICAQAGGVEAFLIGSELRGLSRLRNHDGRYPFAGHLVGLAEKVRRLLPQSKISYAADWSEYGGHVPKDGALDFPLDRFWADENCDFIGIDNYLPLSDWRDGVGHKDAQSGVAEINDTAYLQSQIEGGEYYDWYYASPDARDRQERTPITDGLGKPFVYRAKDIKGWWSNPHIARRDGRETRATAWQPKSKPIWFTELGCPAVDKGANQPNIFPDTRSSEGGVPHYSNGARDDAMQRAFLHAVTDHYAQTAHNPRSPFYDGAMLDTAQIYFWAWDARPFPAFPYRLDIWSDGGNWHTGHWLNGRDASAPLADLVSSISAPVAHRLDPLQGAVEGFAVAGPVRTIDALRPILRAFGVDAVQAAMQVRFAGRHSRALRLIEKSEALVEPAPQRRRENGEKIKRFDVHYIDAEGDYGPTHVSARHQGGDAPVARLNLPLAMTQNVARHLAERLLHESRLAGETLTLALSPRHLDLEVGDLIGFDDDFWRVTRLGYDGRVNVTAVRHMAGLYGGRQAHPPLSALPSGDNPLALPHVEVLDMALPALRHDGFEQRPAPLLAAAAAPWPGQVDVRSGARRWGLTRPSLMGQTLSDLPAGPIGRWDRGTGLEVKLFSGALFALPDIDVLAGGNRLALKTERGWELIQFAHATLLADRHYRLSGLLRGQFGTDDAMAAHLPAQTICVVASANMLPLFDVAGERLSLRYGISGLPEDGYSWRNRDVTIRHAAQTCLSPVHGKLVMPNGPQGNWQVSWIRRARHGGDDFDAPDVPLGEPQELYQTDIWAGDSLVSSRRQTAPVLSLSAKSRKKLAAGQKRMVDWRVEIAQINAQNAPGAVLKIALPTLSKG